MHHFWDTVIEPALDILKPGMIVEIGSDQGLNTRKLLAFCEKNGCELHVIDPKPKYDVAEWRGRHGDTVVFHLDLSLNALPRIDGFDVVLIDGDHNWYTVFNELKLIEEKCDELFRPFPLAMLHYVGWPYGRRDLYYAPETIPEEYRHPYEQKGVHPESTELLEEGGVNANLPNATKENVPRSGVLTAVEDFEKESDREFELLVIPGLNGFGILVPVELKAGNEALAALLDPLDLPEPVARLMENIELTRIKTQIGRQRDRALIAELRTGRNSMDEGSDASAAQPGQRALTNELGRRSRDVKKLSGWIEQLDANISAMLNSRRWKLGFELNRLLSKISARPAEPLVPASVRVVREKFGVWKKRYSQKMD